MDEARGQPPEGGGKGNRSSPRGRRLDPEESRQRGFPRPASLAPGVVAVEMRHREGIGRGRSSVGRGVRTRKGRGSRGNNGTPPLTASNHNRRRSILPPSKHAGYTAAVYRVGSLPPQPHPFALLALGWPCFFRAGVHKERRGGRGEAVETCNCSSPGAPPWPTGAAGGRRRHKHDDYCARPQRRPPTPFLFRYVPRRHCRWTAAPSPASRCRGEGQRRSPAPPAEPLVPAESALPSPALRRAGARSRNLPAARPATAASAATTNPPRAPQP